MADPGKFRTLDTKLLAALTKTAKGELAQQTLNYKESEAQRRLIRNRALFLTTPATQQVHYLDAPRFWNL